MRFALAAEHREYFKKNRFIEFDALLSEGEAAMLDKHAEAAAAKRLKAEPDKLNRKSPSELYAAGRDLWRDDPAIKKISLNSRFAEIAAALFNKKSLRIAYDQYLRFPSPFAHPVTLQGISSFQYIASGVIIRLREGSPQEGPLPKQVGSGLFLHPEYPFSLNFSDASAFFIIVYCGDKTVYAPEKNDPNVHLLKKEGYVFGDLLRSQTHPLIYQ